MIAFLKISASQTNKIPDISYIGNFEIHKIGGRDYFCYLGPTAKKIGADLLLYVKTVRQLNAARAVISSATNVIKTDDHIFIEYEDKIKKTRIRAGTAGAAIGAAIVTGTILILKAAK